MSGLFKGLLQRARPRPSGPPVDSRWRAVELPCPPGVESLYVDVMRGTSADDVWLLCTVTMGRLQQRLAFHFDGDVWRLRDDVPFREHLYPVARDDVWAVGARGGLAHYDGAEWRPCEGHGFERDFVDVYARSGGELWLAATGPSVIELDGEKLIEHQPNALEGSSTHIVWGTGTDVLVPSNPPDQTTRIARFDGQAWSMEELGTGGCTLIHGSGPDDIWALSRRHGGWHFDGSRWRRHMTGPGPYWGLWVESKSHAVAVGDRGVVSEWDGERWSSSTLAEDVRLHAVFAAAGSVWAAGRGLFRRDEGQ